LLDASHRQLLTERKIQFIEIKGNWEERFQVAVEHIKSLIVRKGEQYRY
jgi:HTH-type transcriptional regulator, transcriptional repressor of NAD biosynthesis genes